MDGGKGKVAGNRHLEAKSNQTPVGVTKGLPGNMEKQYTLHKQLSGSQLYEKDTSLNTLLLKKKSDEESFSQSRTSIRINTGDQDQR